MGEGVYKGLLAYLVRSPTCLALSAPTAPGWTVPAMREPLLAAYRVVQVPQVPEFDDKLASSALLISASSYKKWSKTMVAERTAMLRHTADALQAELPRCCALLVKEAFKTWNDAVGEVREAIDFMRYCVA
jgi:RHH-type proline utilization regulon transcriptional repressor/proline dehydrogenase/delta 1-pyrroline-5-carboxylate dehydrogenase